MGRQTNGQRIAKLEATLASIAEKIELYERYERPLPSSNEPFYRKLIRAAKVFSKPLTPAPLLGLFPAYVVDTRDPWKIGRVRVYIPQIHRYVSMSEENFPWANPCTIGGTLDEQGWAGPPPEGSSVLVQFEMGNRNKPVYMGGYWNVTRARRRSQAASAGGDGTSAVSAAEAPLNFNQENRRWKGRRYRDHNPKVNSDQKQLYPPWNNEGYDGPDLKVAHSAEKQNPTTYPFMYGYKSPEKHFLQMVDGNWDETKKGKRLVIQSSRGHAFIMKDDGLNHMDEIYENQNWDDFHDKYPHCLWRVKPFNNHDVNLPMTGIWLQSLAGHRLQMCDLFETPSGDNEWDAGWEPKGRLRSKIRLESITEHRIDLRDREDVVKERGETNGIFAHTAIGQCIQACDHTVDGNRGGRNRRIRLWSTSDHEIEMLDWGVREESPSVRSGPGGRTDFSEGSHRPNATNAHILIRTGWRQFILMADYNKQDGDDKQYIRISNRNEEKDPNYVMMWCVQYDKLFFVRGAGTYVLDVQHNYFRHNWEGNEYITIDEGSQFTNIKKGMDFRHSETLAYYWNTRHISLAVGKLIPGTRGMELENPLYPIVLAHPKGHFVCPITQWEHWDYPTPFVDASGERVSSGGGGSATNPSGPAAPAAGGPASV